MHGEEEAETKALEAHRLATENKATTDRAKQLETDIGKVKAKLEAPQTVAVGHANPLGNVMAKLIGAAADVLTAWQQAVVAAVFELCLVGVMVIFELLGQIRQSGAVRVSQDPAPDQVFDGANDAANLPPHVKTAARTSKLSKGGSVKGFCREHLFPADDDDRVEGQLSDTHLSRLVRADGLGTGRPQCVSG